MRSFTLWYDEKESAEKRPIVKINVNLWEDNSNKTIQTCFDFGFKINDITNVENINLYVPFDINKENISDLGKTISNNTLVNAIFNENFVTTDGNPKKLRVSSLDDDVDENFIIYSLDINSQIDLISSKTSTDEDSKIIQINLSDINLSDTDNIKEYYFRIRIQVPNDRPGFIYNQITSESPFEDYFTNTEVIDFRINDIRSSSEVLREKFESGSHFKIKSVHYLILRDASDIIIHHGNPISSRVLERNTWNGYFGGSKEKNVIAYHIKKKSFKEGKDIKYLKDFSDLSRFKSKKSSIKVLLTAIFIIIILELVSNGIYDFLTSIE